MGDFIEIDIYTLRQGDSYSSDSPMGLASLARGGNHLVGCRYDAQENRNDLALWLGVAPYTHLTTYLLGENCQRVAYSSVQDVYYVVSTKSDATVNALYSFVVQADQLKLSSVVDLPTSSNGTSLCLLGVNEDQNSLFLLTEGLGKTHLYQVLP